MTHSIIIAVILIITGLLVWKYPGLIAGYNTMTPEQQRNVDIKGLKAFMCRAFCLVGIAVILAAYPTAKGLKNMIHTTSSIPSIPLQTSDRFIPSLPPLRPYHHFAGQLYGFRHKENQKRLKTSVYRYLFSSSILKTPVYKTFPFYNQQLAQIIYRQYLQEKVRAENKFIVQNNK